VTKTPGTSRFRPCCPTVTIALQLLWSLWRPLALQRAPGPLGAVVGFFGLLAAVAILAGINWPPEVDPIDGIPIEQSNEAGIFLALAAALGIALGGCLSARKEAGVGASRLDLESTP